MKKLLLTLSVAGGAFMVPAQADTIGFEIGADYWDAGIGGENGSSDGFDDYHDNDNTRIYVLFEHPIPIIPNALISINSIENDEKDGENSLDSSFNDLILYYEVLDNIIELDLGIGARQFTGDISSSTKAYDADPTLPVAYGKAQFNLPVTGLSLGASLLTGAASEDKTTDAAAYVRWESTLGLGLTAGYRSLSSDLEVKSIKVDDKNLILSPELDGAYVSVFFHF